MVVNNKNVLLLVRRFVLGHFVPLFLLGIACSYAIYSSSDRDQQTLSFYIKNLDLNLLAGGLGVALALAGAGNIGIAIRLLYYILSGYDFNSKRVKANLIDCVLGVFYLPLGLALLFAAQTGSGFTICL